MSVPKSKFAVTDATVNAVFIVTYDRVILCFLEWTVHSDQQHTVAGITQHLVAHATQIACPTTYTKKKDLEICIFTSYLKITKSVCLFIYVFPDTISIAAHVSRVSGEWHVPLTLVTYADGLCH